MHTIFAQYFVHTVKDGDDKVSNFFVSQVLASYSQLQKEMLSGEQVYRGVVGIYKVMVITGYVNPSLQPSGKFNPAYELLGGEKRPANYEIQAASMKANVLEKAKVKQVKTIMDGLGVGDPTLTARVTEKSSSKKRFTKAEILYFIVRYAFCDSISQFKTLVTKLGLSDDEADEIEDHMYKIVLVALWESSKGMYVCFYSQHIITILFMILLQYCV